MPPVVVLGLDSMPPDILFDRFLPSMPNLKALMDRGTWGALRTCHPPITVPAWAVMLTGFDPGTIGLYGIHHRPLGTYDDSYVPTPAMVKRKSIWDILSRAGRRVAVIGMPPGYPPPSLNGVSTGDFLTPDGAEDAVFPRPLKAELERMLGEPLLFDVPFRKEDRKTTLADIHRLTRQRWRLAAAIAERERWDLLAIHDIGPDRFHHAFWKFFNPDHPGYSKGNEFEDEAARYYSVLDREIGLFLNKVPADSTILVASDHGSKTMKGCFAINEWLRREGYLVTGEPGGKGTPLSKAQVKWESTRAWATGGYYSRIFFNMRGREPCGIVDKAEAAQLARELSAKLKDIRKADGSHLGVEVLLPKEIYKEVRGDYPDLTAYFGDLSWRAAGTLGHQELFLPENDTGPDDAVHDWNGVYIVASAKGTQRGKGPVRNIIDVAPTLLRIAGMPDSDGMQGRVISDWIP